jgi:hypothetical protein
MDNHHIKPYNDIDEYNYSINNIRDDNIELNNYILPPPFAIDNKNNKTYYQDADSNEKEYISDKKYYDHLNEMNIQYNSNNNKILENNLKYTDPVKPINYDYGNELYVLRGAKVNNKSCNTKMPNYNSGVWINQFNDEIKYDINKKLFDINTKRKAI